MHLRVELLGMLKHNQHLATFGREGYMPLWSLVDSVWTCLVMIWAVSPPISIVSVQAEFHGASAESGNWTGNDRLNTL